MKGAHILELKRRQISHESLYMIYMQYILFIDTALLLPKNFKALLGKNNGIYGENKVRQSTQTMQVCNQNNSRNNANPRKTKYEHKDVTSE